MGVVSAAVRELAAGDDDDEAAAVNAPAGSIGECKRGYWLLRESWARSGQGRDAARRTESGNNNWTSPSEKLLAVRRFVWRLVWKEMPVLEDLL